jgi:hypothetical protein
MLVGIRTTSRDRFKKDFNPPSKRRLLGRQHEAAHPDPTRCAASMRLLCWRRHHAMLEHLGLGGLPVAGQFTQESLVAQPLMVRQRGPRPDYGPKAGNCNVDAR